MRLKVLNIGWVITLGVILIASGCREISFGDDFLGSQPESSGATTEEMFSNKRNAERVLTTAYTGLPYGLPAGNEFKLGQNVLEALTDLHQSFRENVSDGPTQYYYNGVLAANNVPNSANYRFGGKSDWTSIKYAWLYIQNVDAVPDMTEQEKRSGKAEAKAIIALCYAEMMRYVGGVSWIDGVIDVNQEMAFPRLSFAETVDRIVQYLDEAANDLPWKWDDSNNGRMSSAGAKALKLRVLAYAASPTFNSATKWHPKADKYTSYGDYSTDRWTRAEAAGRDFFNDLRSKGGYALEQPSDDSHRARRLAFRKAYYERTSSEVLISTRKGYGEGTHNDFRDQNIYSGPTLNYVNMFEWLDGTPFPENFDWTNPAKEPFYEGENKVPTRDPRLYETVAVPGSNYANGTPAPVYTNHGSYRNGSGFLSMKFVLEEGADRANKPVHWPYIRLAEVMLTYAEVLAEVNGAPTTEAFTLLNDIRSRVGMPPIVDNGMNKETFIKVLMDERARELGFEEVRWFDLVRRGMVGDFTKPRYGLRVEGNDALHPTSFTYEKITLPKRFWDERWDTKWYLAPIPQDEINKDYGMTQNPGW